MTGPRGGARSRPGGGRVSSGWTGPDGRIEEAPGTALHKALVARFGEPTRDGFFARGAVRHVEATEHVSLELMGQHPVALGPAIEALTRRWPDMANVEVDLPDSLYQDQSGPR